MDNLITQIAIVNDSTGMKKITYSYDTIDENGKTIKSNQRKSFLVLDEETKVLISNLEAKAKENMNVE